MISKRALLLGVAGVVIGITPAYATTNSIIETENKKIKRKINGLNRFVLNCNSNISPSHVKKLVNTYGTNILIGIDPGSKDTPNSSSLVTIKATKTKIYTVPLHVYLVGPGMMSWSSEERKQIAYMARTVKIDTNKSNWKQQWYSTGWKRKNIQQFEYYYKNYNAYSCEIDNIDSSTIRRDPIKTVNFYNELNDTLKEKGIKTKLMIKNLSESQLEAVIDAKFTTDFLCEFGMFEAGTGNHKKQIALCEKIGIQAITPINGITPSEQYGTITNGVEYSLN